MFNNSYFGQYFGQYFGGYFGLQQVVVETLGGGGFYTHHQYKRYLEYLEQIKGAVKEEAISDDVIQAAEIIIEKTPIKLKQIAKIATLENKDTQIELDFKKLERELSRVENYLNKMLEQYILYEKRMREDEELIMVLM
jgi:hypothetical protein